MKCPKCGYEHSFQKVVFVKDDENLTVEHRHIENRCPICETTFMTVESWKLMNDRYEDDDED